MGAISSTFGRRNGGVEEVDIASHSAYRYPPKTGNYFGSHYIMGGERFDMSQPESYLFGENSDLNFLGNKPVPFPYPAATGNEPTKTLKSLVNIRKDSLRLVKVGSTEKPPADQQQSPHPEQTAQTGDEVPGHKYNVEFIFDCDVKCSIKIIYFATEEMNSNQIIYHSKVPSLTSEVYHYKRGANHMFQQPTHVVDPSVYADEEWQFNPDKDIIPMVLLCTTEEEEHLGHAHMTFAVVERSSLDGCYIIKALKQKQFVHGLCYLLQEIYGIENKNNEKNKEDDDLDDDVEDSGAECVICMSDMRDTLILPCRHLCLCSTCAESLRYQASSCPICRSPFRALLQIRAMRRKPTIALQQCGGDQTEDTAVSQEGVPPGYEAVSLIEALNGPCGLPPLNTMEGIHVPPPSRLAPNTETETNTKRRSTKNRQHVPVETVKVMSQEEMKIPEEHDAHTLPKTGPHQEAVKTSVEPLQKAPRTKPNRHRAKPDGELLPRSPSSDKDLKEDSLELVNEVHGKGDASRTRSSLSDVDPDSQHNLTPDYPPLTVSSENLADDEREDTSEGELEPEVDYDLEEVLENQEEVDRIPAPPPSDLNLPSPTTDNFPSPPTYSSVMDEGVSTPQDTEDLDTEVDADYYSSVPFKLRLSTSPPSSEESTGSSHHSSHNLLPQDEDKQKI